MEVRLRVRDGHLIVPVTAPDGSELEFGIATSSPPTGIAEELAARLGEAAALTLGGLPLPPEREHWTAAQLPAPGGARLDGVLGAAFLSDYEILIDPPGGRMQLRSVGPETAWPGVDLADPVAIQILHGAVVSLTAEVNGTGFFTLLDLASTSNVFSPAVGDKLALADEGEAEVGIGTRVLPGQPYRVRDLDLFRRFDPNGNGFVILGAPIVESCAMAVSWARRELRTCAR